MKNTYNGIISITTWSARIRSVGLTIYSLLKNCPNFKILLSLSRQEFPAELNELPYDVQMLTKSNVIELCWTNDNPKEFKKIEAFKRYPQLPCIFVDDDMFYTINFAQELYTLWLHNQKSVFSYVKTQHKYGCCMACSLFSPVVFNLLLSAYQWNNGLHDDSLFAKTFETYNINVVGLYHKFPGFFHDEAQPLNGSTNMLGWLDMQQFPEVAR